MEKGAASLPHAVLRKPCVYCRAELVHVVRHCASLGAEHTSPFAKQWQLPISLSQSREKEDVHPLKKAVNLQSPHQWGM